MWRWFLTAGVAVLAVGCGKSNLGKVDNATVPLTGSQQPSTSPTVKAPTVSSSSNGTGTPGKGTPKVTPPKSGQAGQPKAAPPKLGLGGAPGS